MKCGLGALLDESDMPFGNSELDREVWTTTARIIDLGWNRVGTVRGSLMSSSPAQSSIPRP